MAKTEDMLDLYSAGQKNVDKGCVSRGLNHATSWPLVLALTKSKLKGMGALFVLL